MDDDTTLLAEAMAPVFGRVLRGMEGGPAGLEAGLLGAVLAAAREALSRALEDWDRELCSSLPDGVRVHAVRPRTLATRLGDVAFRRRVCRDRAGNPVVPLDEALDLAEGSRVSPGLEAWLVRLAADVSYAKSARIAAEAGGSRVSPTCVMGCVRRAGAACRADDERRAEELFRDGVVPEGTLVAEALMVESDGTSVRPRRDGADRVEVKAVTAYAGKEASASGGKVRRRRPVSFGMVGTPAQLWTQAVAAIAERYDLSKVRTVHSGFDGAGWCKGGEGHMGFAEVVGHLDPFHANRAVGRCFDPGHAGGAREVLECLWDGDAEGAAGLLEAYAASGEARAALAQGVAAYLRNNAAHIGADGPSLGTMEAENQHVYKSRMASVPCAWSRRGADDMARIRSRACSGRRVLRLSRRDRVTDRARSRREARVMASLASSGLPASKVVQSEGRGWEPPRASVAGAPAEVVYKSGRSADLKLRDPH